MIPKLLSCRCDALVLILLAGIVTAACADAGGEVQVPTARMGESPSSGDRGYSTPLPKGGVVKRGVAVPSVEAFPAVLSVLSGLQSERTVYIINHEESAIQLGSGEFSCGCLEGSETKGVLGAHAVKELKLVVAAVSGKKADSVTVPFIAHGHSWELRIAIERR